MIRSMVKQILFATDFSESAGKARDHAVLFAKAYEARLHVVHVADSPLWYGSNAATILYLEQARQEGERQLVAIEQQLMDSGVTAVEVRQPAGSQVKRSRKRLKISAWIWSWSAHADARAWRRFCLAVRRNASSKTRHVPSWRSLRVQKSA